MRTAKAITQIDPLQGLEYTIYTFDQKDKSSWTKQNTRDERAIALGEAEKLFNSGRYKKVEVKQKYFDKKKNRNIDVTIKVYEDRKTFEINIAMVFLFSVLCGALAFAITYYINHQ